MLGQHYSDTLTATDETAVAGFHLADQLDELSVGTARQSTMIAAEAGPAAKWWNRQGAAGRPEP
ncbi:hypothetical protein [Amycolatopsis sp. H20-H5]|uniref:hypothetical protein n=1 Tax=Amycolatopsis sp. H20-H5 TaxID=3046309 RepID=UPI002DB8B2C7|nr:hypothetical protein [Amycolatopsis sp. H20-H5]MEC3980168.1 hypothetical protein [Amycolatopsis sp. H20-H5]